MKPIISKAEARQILENDLRRAALQKHADELAGATAEAREKILAGIEQEIKKRLRRHMWPIGLDSAVLYSWEP